ncbi:hypothetical protein C8R43DRAFT_1139409 [Mycena crocata]|nr:hypothetical protein C8R43DRAFT_1139409 [Mycena crocata]
MALIVVYIEAATLTVETLFYGIYSVLFFLSIYLFVLRYNTTHSSPELRKNNSIFKSVVFKSAILLFVVVTTLRLYRTFLAFGALQRFAEGKAPLNEHTRAWETAQDSVLSVVILLCDSLITHRLWVVWSPNRLVLVVPVLSLTVLSFSSSLSTYTTVHNPDVFSNAWLKANIALTLITTFYCTVFISWKIWTVTRLSISSERNNLTRFLVIVVESAAFYAVWTLFFAIAYATRSSIQVFVITTGPPVVGMVNALIHARVGLGWASEQGQGAGLPAASSLRFVMLSAEETTGGMTSVV